MSIHQSAKFRREQNAWHDSPQGTAPGTAIYRLACLTCLAGFYTDMLQRPTCPACDTGLLSLTAVWDLQGPLPPRKAVA